LKSVFDKPVSEQDKPEQCHRMPMKTSYRDFLIRSWKPSDREKAAAIIRDALAEYGLGWEPTGADRDVLEVEASYNAVGGEFWVIEQQGQLVGTAAYYPVERGEKAVEIRKMYLSPAAREKDWASICYRNWKRRSPIGASTKFGLKRLASLKKRSNSTKVVVINPLLEWRHKGAIAFTSSQ
jgi:hypothetical protein